MEFFLTLEALFGLLVALFAVVLSFILRRRPKYNLPPGPKPWPVIGNLYLIGSLPHRSVHKLSLEYGPIMLLKFGSFPVIVGSSVNMAKEILKTNDSIFSGRPQLAAGKYTTYNYSDITWSQYGEYWNQARKLCAVELFSPKRLTSLEYIRVEETNRMVKNIYRAEGEPISVKDNLSDVSLNVISRMVLGKAYAIKSAAENEIVSPEEFKEMLDELFLLNGVLEIGDSIPWLAPLDIQGYIKRMKALSKKFDRFLEHVLDEHDARRKETENYVAKDMVDVLLQFAEDPTLKVKIDRQGVKAFTQDLIAGGTESSAVTVEWAMSELMKKPELFDKAREEIERVIGKERWVEEKDIPELPFLSAIVKETMRLHPVAPLLVPRLARENVKIAGYDIPKGYRVLVSSWTIGRDPGIWEKPEEFCPERFLGMKIGVEGRDLELLPFGAGRRMCPGYSLGYKVIQTSLANLVHGFTWTLPAGMSKEELGMEEIFGLSTPRKDPLIAVAVPRLHHNLY